MKYGDRVSKTRALCISFICENTTSPDIASAVNGPMDILPGKSLNHVLFRLFGDSHFSFCSFGAVGVPVFSDLGDVVIPNADHL